MKNDCLISIIIPVYKTEAYLDACIRSIVNQTYPNLQIILVDDGSPDGCGTICDAWATKDPRIQVIHQENRGVSAARNAGLDAATGDMISFVDSDDLLPPYAYGKLLVSMADRDLVMGGMQQIDEAGTPLPYQQKLPPTDLSRDAFLKDLFEEKKYSYLGYLCDKLFLTSIIQNNRIRFDPSVRINEDRLFLLEYILHSGSLAFTDTLVYYYRQRSAGAVLSTRRSPTVSDSEMTIHSAFCSMIRLSKTCEPQIYPIVVRKAFECGLDMIRRVSREEPEKVREIRRFMRKNALVYTKIPGIGIWDKVKVLGHCILEK